jgi:hypothetical protein
MNYVINMTGGVATLCCIESLANSDNKWIRAISWVPAGFSIAVIVATILVILRFKLKKKKQAQVVKQ